MHYPLESSSYRAIFDQYHRLLYVLAYRYLRSENRAEDAVQFTFMRLWERRSEMDFSHGVRSLLVTIMKNYVLNELRHDKIIVEHQQEMLQREDVNEDMTEQLESHERMRSLREAINSLPEQKRKICLLKLEEELSNQEIADRLGIALPTVKSHYTAALKQLRGIIKRFMLILLMV